MNSRLVVALATPALLLLALVGLLQRHGVERLQALPSLLISGGLLVVSAEGYRRRRHRLLRALRDPSDLPPP